MGHGHHNIRFDGDPYANNGVWSPPSSRANFCEEDYGITFYIAEFINSLTNIAYVYLAFRAMYGSSRSRGLFAPDWDFMSIMLVTLGICSFLFHASLRQTMEFADELSMIGLIWCLLQATLSIRQPPNRKRIISVVLAIVILGFSAFYVWSAKIIHQVIAFNLGLGAIGLRTHYLLWWSGIFSEDKARKWARRTWEAAGICVFGYILWNIDLEFCHTLREFRQQIGLPWAWLLELHGWWHVLTAIGAARFMSVAREIRDEASKKGKSS